MTDAKTDLKCPECGGKITRKQLAADGMCLDCVQKALDELPPPASNSPAPQASTDGAGPPETTPDQVTTPAAPAPADADTLQQALGLIMASVLGAEQIRADIWKLEGDEVANAIGNWCDLIIGTGRETLDYLGAPLDELPEQA